MVEPFLEEIPLHIDDRGSVYCALDHIGTHRTGEHPSRLAIKRTYIVQNYGRGLIRAWHGHKQAWTGLHVFKGAAKIIGKNIEDSGQIKTFTLSGRKPGIVWVPPGWYNGTMSLEDDTRILVYSTLSFDEVKKDDFRDYCSQDEIRDLWQVQHR